MRDHKHTDKSPSESEHRYRRLIEALPAAIYICDAQGRITFYNDIAATIWGRKPEIGKDLWCGARKLYHPDGSMMAHEDCPMAVAIREGRSVRGVEIVVERPNGTRSYVLPHPDPIRDASGMIVGAVNMVIDLTERRAAEEALRESELRFRQLAENINKVFWLANPEVTQIHYVSPAYEKMWGRSCTSLYAEPTSWMDSVHPDDRERAREVRAQAVAGEHDQTYRIVCPDGSLRWVHDRAFPVRDDSGNLVRIAGVAEDITELKNAEALVARAREFYLTLLDWFPTPIWRSDVNGECNYFNQTWLSFTGRTIEQERGHGWSEGVHPEDLTKCLKVFHDAFALRRPFEMEYRLRRYDGEYRWVIDHGQLFHDLEGQFAGYIGSCYDITERKQTEDSLRTLSHRLLRAEDEERRRIAKELHDSTAQDLVAVMMNLGLLQDALGERDGKFGEIITDSLAILENSTNDIRTLSYVVHPPRLDETGLVGALTEFAAGFGKRADIRVRVELPPDLDRLPEEIELALFRVVQESLANVLRHSKSETATIRLMKSEKRIVVEVIDFGRGLPHTMTAQSPGALGVGIAGMRERMQHFGGRLELDSSSKGTTVRAVLPLPKDRNENP